MAIDLHAEDHAACRVCGETFTIDRHRPGQRPIYCSETCRAAYRAAYLRDHYQRRRKAA